MFIKSTFSSPARTEFKGVVAHRGSQRRAPENTMASFRAALEDGAKIFELDVSETSDLLKALEASGGRLAGYG